MTSDDLRWAALAGGTEAHDSGWRAVLELHVPCSGADHRTCTVIERLVGPTRPKRDEATDDLILHRHKLGEILKALETT